MALKVASVDGGELENDNHALKSSRQGWSVCNKQRASKEFLDWVSKEAVMNWCAPGYLRESFVVNKELTFG